MQIRQTERQRVDRKEERNEGRKERSKGGRVSILCYLSNPLFSVQFSDTKMWFFSTQNSCILK